MKKVVKFLLLIWPLIGDVSEIEAAIIKTQALDKAISYCEKRDSFGSGYCSGVRNTIRAMLPYTKSWPHAWQCLPAELKLETDIQSIVSELQKIREGINTINRNYQGNIAEAKLDLIAKVDKLLDQYGPEHPTVNARVEQANVVFAVPNTFTGRENISEIIMLAYHQIHKCK